MKDARDNGPADHIRQLWQQGQSPDLDAILADLGEVSVKTLAAILRADQASRWCVGMPVAVEDYFRRYPAAASDPETAIDLILNEFVLAEANGRRPNPDEFSRRFPEHAETLHGQLDWHRTVTSRCTVDTFTISQPTTRVPVNEGQLVLPQVHTAIPLDTEPTQLAGELPNPFGRYRILELLGRGGMGAVYAAHDPQLDRRVALKVPGFGFADKEVIERFLREARIAAAFNDPHLCPVYEVGEVGGTYYLTMPVIEGKTLADLLRTAGPLPPKEAVRVAATVARAMLVAHSAGVIHRDLKPANIFQSNNGQPVITDFGLARHTAAQSTDSVSGRVIVGTPAYMAPEQVNGEMQSIGPGTDVYSLGVVLYEMLAGTRPFDGPLGSLLAQIITDDPEPITNRRAEIDGRLSAICCKALSKTPADRYLTMGEFANALDGWLETADLPRRRRRPPAKRMALALAAIAVAIVSGILIAQRWTSPSPQPDPESAIAARDPEAAKARAELAWRLNNEDDLDRAIEESTAALRLDDRCVGALLCRGNALIKKKAAKLAAEDLLRVISIDPASDEAEVDLAWACNELGEHENALAHADRAIVLQPDSAEAHNQRGWANYRRGLHRDAIVDFTNAILHNPRYVWAYRNRALAYKNVGEDALAAKDEAQADEFDSAGGKKR